MTDENRTEAVRWALRNAIDGARGAMLLGADGNLLAAVEILAEVVFGKDWRPVFDWEARNR